ncbi:uncharacterized protein LOC134448546 isoform X2 [Engraulis encrasicolus]|uniref:uncharacterized protein LOC134448546 isoform X2 n=1 Tax=Engraulis encrasicolus TaxID=184585 RepID=UPI002FD56BC9
MQSEEEARAIETAVRAAVLSVVEVVNHINTIRLEHYQRKVAERDKENAVLRAEIIKAEEELVFLRRLMGLQQSEHLVAAPSTELQVQAKEINMGTHHPKRARETDQRRVKQSKVTASIMSAAEKQRLYRARRDADPRRRAEYLESEKKRWMKDRLSGKKKLINERSPKERSVIRRKWRLASERRRASKVSIQLQTALNSEGSHPQEAGSDSEFQFECLSLETTTSVQGSSAPVMSPSHDTGGHMDFTGFNLPLVKEERAKSDTVYIKCEVKEENASDSLEDVSTHQDHSFLSCTLERETLDSYSFTHHHHPSEVQSDTISGHSAPQEDDRLPCSLPRRGKKGYDDSRERLRRHRERVRADPVKHQAYLEKERRRYQQRKKPIHELPEEMQRHTREVWRRAARRKRDREKSQTGYWAQPL